MTTTTPETDRARTLAGIVPAAATGVALRTPGRPPVTYAQKGCILSHAKLLAVADGCIERLELGEPPPVIYLYLPLAHVLARVTALVAMATGGTLAFWSGERERLAQELAEAAPTHVPTVPRLLEKIRTQVLNTAGPRGVLVRSAIGAGERVARSRREARRPAITDRLLHAVTDRLVLARIRAAFGPDQPLVLTGAAPIGPEVLEFSTPAGSPCSRATG